LTYLLDPTSKIGLLSPSPSSVLRRPPSSDVVATTEGKKANEKTKKKEGGVTAGEEEEEDQVCPLRIKSDGEIVQSLVLRNTTTRDRIRQI
jgi:hypothetical protein